MMDVQISLAWPCQSRKHSIPEFGGESLSRAEGNRPHRQNCLAVVDPSALPLLDAYHGAKPLNSPSQSTHDCSFFLCDAAATWRSRRKTVNHSVALHMTCSENSMCRSTPIRHHVVITLQARANQRLEREGVPLQWRHRVRGSLNGSVHSVPVECVYESLNSLRCELHVRDGRSLCAQGHSEGCLRTLGAMRLRSRLAMVQ